MTFDDSLDRPIFKMFKCQIRKKILFIHHYCTLWQLEIWKFYRDTFDHHR